MEKNLKSLILICTGVVIVVLGLAVLMGGDSDLSLGGGDGFAYSQTHATTTTTSAGYAKEVLTPQTGRKYAIITNTSATIAYLAFHSTTSPHTVPLLGEQYFAIPLAASGGSYTINQDNLYTGRVIATSTAAVSIRAMQVY